jgi:hypothetical protein
VLSHLPVTDHASPAEAAGLPAGMVAVRAADLHIRPVEVPGGREVVPAGAAVAPGSMVTFGHPVVAAPAVIRGGRRSLRGSADSLSDSPGANVNITTSIDRHHSFARYGWQIADRTGTVVLDGIDVVELAEDGQLQRIVMFFGPLRPRD